MKKILGILTLASVIANTSFAQTVSGSIRRGASPNIVEVVAKPTAAINAQVGNINITFSIPDQGAANPTEASITKTTTLNNVNLTPTDGNNPYIIDGRAYYSYLILQNLSADQATSFVANDHNLIATFDFGAPYNSAIRLDDLTSTGGGPNFQMTWYVQFNQGIGDVTDYNNPFYGYYNPGDATNNAGAAAQWVTLVVKFLNFSVAKRDNDAVLNWVVENEGTITEKYEIETSVNGLNFSKVSAVPALNNGRTSNTYSAVVENLSAIKTSGVIYFRVKQIDRDGKFVYTPIRSLRLDGKQIVMSVYPNPVKSIATLSYELTENTDVMVTLTDAAGKLVYNKQVQGFKGANTTPLDMSTLAKGTYNVKVQYGSEVKVLSVVKQ